ncbi:MAG: DUF4976 domain-containing protein, partial [Pirellulaceae bacterium]|nr:DUF4976 domain-containing protein [Pirellulaceae bacterium]
TGYSLRTARHRYTEWGADGAEGAELYDHNNDPAEMTNLANNPDQSALIERLAKELHARIADAMKPPSGVTQIKFENRRRVRN